MNEFHDNPYTAPRPVEAKVLPEPLSPPDNTKLMAMIRARDYWLGFFFIVCFGLVWAIAALLDVQQRLEERIEVLESSNTAEMR